MAIVHVETKEEFKKEVVESDKPVIVDFWAPWCGPCKMLAPVFEHLAQTRNDVKFVKVDIDEAEELAAEFNIMSIPYLMIVSEGKVVADKAGAMQKDQLMKFIDDNKDKSA